MTTLFIISKILFFIFFCLLLSFYKKLQKRNEELKTILYHKNKEIDKLNYFVKEFKNAYPNWELKPEMTWSKLIKTN